MARGLRGTGGRSGADKLADAAPLSRNAERAARVFVAAAVELNGKGGRRPGQRAARAHGGAADLGGGDQPAAIDGAAVDRKTAAFAQKGATVATAAMPNQHGAHFGGRQHRVAPSAPALQGYIDEASWTRITGWVWDPQRPDSWIALELMDGDTPSATVLASGYREDLQQAGIGDGRHAFTIPLGEGLLPYRRHILHLRCTETGAEVPGSPIVMEPFLAAGPTDGVAAKPVHKETEPHSVGDTRTPAPLGKRSAIHRAGKNMRRLDSTRIDGEFSQIMKDWFDPVFYTSVYPDINHPDVDPAAHYHFHGWKENRDPSPNFCTEHYLSMYEDARKAAINPLIYHLLVGKLLGHVPAKSPGVPISEIAVPQTTTLRFSSSAMTVVSPEMRRFAFNVTRPLSPDSNEYDPLMLNIHWVVPDFSQGSGGHMNIFRICNELEARGHRLTIWIRDPSFHNDTSSAKQTLHRHFKPIAGSVRFVGDDGVIHASGDIIVATDAGTVPIVCSASRFKRRFYFVQDFEPAFSPAGARNLITEATYRMDLDCICAGPWLERLMAEKYGRWARKFWQAADRSVYRPAERRGSAGSLPRIAFYCRGFSDRRAVELGLLALELLSRGGISFHVDFFGQDELPFSSVPYSATNRGVCDATTLAEIYQNADIGVVFSATNYSIVPQEMMACRLPVLDLDLESTRAVYGGGIVLLAKAEPQTIAHAMESLLANAEARVAQADRAEKWVSQFSWRESADLVEAAFTERLDELGFEPAQPAISAPSKHFATVVIPTLNGGALLKDVVEQVMSQRIPGNLHLICIDSGSTDGTTEFLEAHPGVELIKIDKAEFQHGRTRNVGVAAARSEFVAFLTQDALPVDDCWLYNLVCVLLSYPKAGGVFGRHVPYEHVSDFIKRDIVNHFTMFDDLPPCVSLENKEVRDLFGSVGGRQKLHFYSDNNSCLRKSVWKSVPIPEVYFGEDQLFAMELLKQGYGKAYARHAAVYHSHDDPPDMVEQRSYIEAQSFYEHFGYRLVQSKNGAARDLDAQNRSDIFFAKQHGVLKENLTRRLAQNKSRIDGYLRALREYQLVP